MYFGPPRYGPPPPYYGPPHHHHYYGPPPPHHHRYGRPGVRVHTGCNVF